MLQPIHPIVHSMLAYFSSIQQLKSGALVLLYLLCYPLFAQEQMIKETMTRKPTTSLQQQLLANLEQAQFYLDNQQPQDALDFNSKALSQLQYLDIPEYAWQLYQQRAHILDSQQKPQQALQFWQLAVEQIQRLQAQQQFRQIQLLGEFQQTQVRYAKQLLRTPIKDTKQQQLEQVLETWEGLKQAQINEFLGSSCVIPKQKIRPLLRQKAGVAIIYPIAIEHRIELLLAIGNEIKRIPIAQDYRRIKKLSQRLNRSISQLRPEYLRYSKALYRALITPLLAHLEQKDIHSLVWVEEKSLSGLTLAALASPEGRFLIEDYALAYSPGLKLLSNSVRNPIISKALMIGENKAVNYQAANYPALPAVDAELNSLIQLFPDSLNLNTKQDKNSALNQLATENYHILHIASHSQIGSDLSKSFFLMDKQAISFSELAHYISQRQYARYPLELISLSACDTASQQISLQADTEQSSIAPYYHSNLGLAGLLVNTGARSVLASLWKVDDKASSLLMQGFYQQWNQQRREKPDSKQFLKKQEVKKHRGQTGKAFALQQAQIHLLNSNYRHPFYWSGFILIGHWD